MPKKVTKTMQYGPLVLMMGVIFFLSHQTGDSIDIDFGFQSDKLLHALIYAVLCFTLLWSMQDLQHKMSPVSFNALIMIFCTVYALSDEWHQSFVPFRTASLADILADGVGASCALLVWKKWRFTINTR